MLAIKLMILHHQIGSSGYGMPADGDTLQF